MLRVRRWLGRDLYSAWHMGVLVHEWGSQILVSIQWTRFQKGPAGWRSEDWVRQRVPGIKSRALFLLSPLFFIFFLSFSLSLTFPHLCSSSPSALFSSSQLTSALHHLTPSKSGALRDQGMSDFSLEWRCFCMMYGRCSGIHMPLGNPAEGEPRCNPWGLCMHYEWGRLGETHEICAAKVWAHTSPR